MVIHDVVLPVSDVVWHERVCPSRVMAVARSARLSGIEKPIWVTPHRDRWLILDGAHRAVAARMLDLSEVPALVIPPSQLPDSAPIDGWTHVLTPHPWARRHLRSAAQRSRAHTGPVVARVVTPEGFSVVRAASACARDLARAMKGVADAYQHRPYNRSAAARPRVPGKIQITWTLPTWGTIIDVVETCGPLPAGVSRLAPVLGLAQETPHELRHCA